MAGGFEGGVCGGNWWINPSQNLFTSSPCLFPSNDMLTTAFTTTTTTRSDNYSSGSASDESCVLLPDTDQQWSQELLFGFGKSDQNYSHHLLQESIAALDSSMDYRHQTRGNGPLRINDTIFCGEDSSSINSSSFSASQSYNSSLQYLFDLDSQPPQQSLEGCSLPISDMINSNQFLPSYYLPMTLEKQQNNLHFTHNTPLWNATKIIDNVRASPLVHRSSNNNAESSNFAVKLQNVEAPEMVMVAKKDDEPPLKRSRIETPSPLPTFKVRKEKLGDRVTALQQLVSPFGKTDTASVLYEAIEYIKFLHDQVNALSTPYLKSSSPPLQCQQDTEKNRHQEEIKKDLKSRGLCLVPVSSTFPVVSETTADFWTPTFGGSYR